MNNVVIYYGSKEKFNRIIPKDYRNLTDLVYESDKDGKTMKLVIPNQHGEYPKEEKEEKILLLVQMNMLELENMLLQIL